jgi:hypothetical protein
MKSWEAQTSSRTNEIQRINLHICTVIAGKEAGLYYFSNFTRIHFWHSVPTMDKTSHDVSAKEPSPTWRYLLLQVSPFQVLVNNMPDTSCKGRDVVGGSLIYPRGGISTVSRMDFFFFLDKHHQLKESGQVNRFKI